MPKQLLRREGVTLLRRTVEKVLATGADAVFVVLGAGLERMRGELDGLQVTVVVNQGWSSGLASSLKAGACAVAAQRAGQVLLVGVDQPMLDAAHLARLLAAARERPEHEVVSGYAGTIGIPAVVTRATLQQAGSLTGDRGLKTVLAARPRTVVDNPALAEDIDTPEALARLRASGVLD
ncbi:NTP transferase domain-containing protein [Lysobacter sp. SG-8]|uniref:NTP transferase domain-containing protein n=2 Tax=Marilutibacter penaei TaxID=2759900 RepID=A0A7W3YF45_9GAMM|nr:NTP transferase domain-containing protein [Lysobacter penaei]